MKNNIIAIWSAEEEFEEFLLKTKTDKHFEVITSKIQSSLFQLIKEFGHPGDELYSV